MTHRSFESVLNSNEVRSFLIRLESSIADDLWKSAGGPWAQRTLDQIKAMATQKFNQNLAEIYSSLASEVNPQDESQKLTGLCQKAWSEVVRSFHKDQFWGFEKLEKKEKLPLTEEQKTFREMFSYIWTFIQAALIVKTAVLYFGIKSASEDSSSDKIWVVVCVLFSFGSLCFFAYRKGKNLK